jgi:hypothetical protein
VESVEEKSLYQEANGDYVHPEGHQHKLVDHTLEEHQDPEDP